VIPALSVVFNVLITFSGNLYTRELVLMFCNFVLLLCVDADVTATVTVAVNVNDLLFAIAPTNH
jgi:hypothetical protein